VTPDDLVVGRHGLRFRGRSFPAAIGAGGLTRRKCEGDGATPVGTHRLVGMLYRPDRMAKPADWALPIRPGDLWSDDVTDPDYNHMVSRPHPYRHESLRRADPLYDLILITDWNWPYTRKGHGSAIFIHNWRKPRHPTAGCVALRRDHLLWIAPRIRYHTRLIVLG
jgi:L,D-peptidoglycan transpeptidase YkuD (ErfK/YbiS/YcfS/YnhG family)